MFGIRSGYTECRFGLFRAVHMDARFQDILDTLPEKPPRSRLEPYGELIDELRRRGRTYRDIVGILAEKCQLRVSVSTIHDFVRVRSRTTRKPVKHRRTTAPKANPDVVRPSDSRVKAARKESPPTDEVQRRIATFKLRSAPAKPSPPQFQYDPDQPLRLPAKTRKR
jgi:IS30 family transposase